MIINHIAKRIAGIVVVPLFLAGCSGGGTLYSELPADARIPKQGMLQLVFYRPASFKYGLRPLKIKVNDKDICSLHNGSYLIREMQPGTLNIAVLLWGMAGASRLNIKAAANEQYYLKMTVDNDKFSAGLPSAEGGGAAIGVSLHPIVASDGAHAGPFIISLENRKSAEADLAGIPGKTQCD